MNENSLNRTKVPGWIISFAWMSFGFLINIIISSIGAHYELPIYLDSIGTIIATVCGGLLPGCLAGVCTNVMSSFSDPSSMYYMFANMIVAVVTFWLFRKKKFFTLPLLILLPILAGILCGSYTAVIMWFLNGQVYPVDSTMVGDWLQLLGVPPLQGAVIGNLGMDIIDKAISVIIAVIIIFILKKVGIYKDEVRDTTDTVPVRSMSLSLKLGWLLIIVITFIGLSAIYIGSWLFRESSIEDHMTLGKGVSSLIAKKLTPDRVDNWINGGYSEPDYRTTEEDLIAIRDSYPDIHYVYVYKILEDGCHVVFDLDTEELEGDEPGAVVPFDESFGPYIDDLLAGKRIDPIITDDTFGWLLTVYTPVYDSKGQCVCYAAIDVSMDRIRILTQEYFVKLAALFLTAVMMGLIILMTYTRHYISEPLVKIASASMLDLDTEEDRRQCIANMEALSINTGDEVEYLYGELLNNMKDTVTYMETLRKKEEDLGRLQDGLIKVLAEAVESRDLSTGNHIKRTAAYVHLIMQKLNDDSVYSDEITDEFINSVTRSAPLHDVGKIEVPDAILNKPGRLTDEEFDTIKTHTTHGVEIIDQAIDVVPDPMYLKEARDMAYYHHEKWDGKGYPTGIAGDDIPLAARVMAVADVFDALVSKRCYKKEFPIDKALDIIREGSGSHFDPVVAKAFLDCEDEVVKLVEEFKDEEQ